MKTKRKSQQQTDLAYIYSLNGNDRKGEIQIEFENYGMNKKRTDLHNKTKAMPKNAANEIRNLTKKQCTKAK